MTEPDDEAGVDANNDHDSTFGPSLAGSTKTLSSRTLRYRKENGRLYHAYKDGIYLFPNDQKELDRLDLQHHLFSLTFEDKLHTCPLDGKKLHHVLDMGTGSGIWAIDFADKYPQAQVHGIDLSPIQPVWVPPNVLFELDDLEATWVFSNKFDFIYSRMMIRAFRNWSELYRQCFENLDESGFIEVVDICFPPKVYGGKLLPDDSYLKKWADLLVKATTSHGCPIDGAKNHKSQLRDAGFVKIVEKTYVWPQNQWPIDKKGKELGAWTFENLAVDLEGFSLAPFTRVLKWTKEEVEVLCANVRKEMKDKEFHVYWEISVIYAQKPWIEMREMGDGEESS